MNNFEYKVIPAPRQGVRVKGAKGTAGRFSGALEIALNELSSKGWEYVRAESLPAIERHGITRRKVETYQNVLIFRRLLDDIAIETAEPVLRATPTIINEDMSENVFSDLEDDDAFPEETTEVFTSDEPSEPK